MKSREWECCGVVRRCVPPNRIDTTDCPQKDSSGNCCGDETNCASALGIAGDDCPAKVDEK